MLRPTVLLSHRTVLVVDDEEPMRLLVARVMEEDGYRVITAGDGLQALDIVEEDGHQIQLVITDVSMPIMSGLELAARLASRTAAPPVLFMSGKHHRDLPGPLLSKPFLPEDLSNHVRRLLHCCQRDSRVFVSGAIG
jgi:two-component system cell cycle sensor histidine kinase/response regulator CckA